MVRFKNRYFVAEIEVMDHPPHAPLPLNKNILENNILKKIHDMHGDFGLASVTSGFKLKYCNPYTKIVLIRSRHGPHRFVGTVLPLIKVVKDLRVQFKILYMGGTIMKCFKFIRNHQLATLEKFWCKMKTDEDRAQFKEALMKLNIK